MQRIIYFLFATTLFINFGANGQVFNILEYGARPDSTFNSTEGIQKAIDACKKAGGGQVFFPPGKYKSATLNLCSNLDFFLSGGTTLFASPDPRDYKGKNTILDDSIFLPILLYGKNLQRVSLSGYGVIDGQARQAYLPLKEVDNYIINETMLAKQNGVEMKRYYTVGPKVRLIFLDSVNDLIITNLTIQNSPNWTLHLQDCKKVNIEKIKIYSSLEKGVNADGLDIDDCHDVTVSDCIIKTGDDAICLKSTKKPGSGHSCKNVVVNNCIVSSTSTALKLGTESHNGFENIIFSNCIVENSNRGCGIFVRDGAKVNNVQFNNIFIETKRKHFNWWGDGEAFHVVLQKRNDSSRIGSINNIYFNNITAFSEGYSKVISFTDKPIGNVFFNNIRMSFLGENTPDKRADCIVKLGNVNLVGLNNFSLNVTQPNPGMVHALKVANVKNLDVNNSRIISKAGLGFKNPLMTEDTKISGKFTLISD